VQDPEVVTDPCTLNRTMTPGQGCPDALVTVAVTVWVVPTGLTASGGVRVTVAGVPQLPPGMVVVVVVVVVEVVAVG